MPNHVHNILSFKGDQSEISRLLSLIQYDDEEEENNGIGTIDFNKVIPMPKELHETPESSTKSDGMALVLHFSNPKNKKSYEGINKMSPSDFEYYVSMYKNENKFRTVKTTLSDKEVQRMTQYTSIDELISLGVKALGNMKKYGATCWYPWAIKNWGTKWNSYDNWYDGKSIITFNTAWSAPHSVIEKIAEMFPSVEIIHRWADEDIGSNCGKFTYKDGKCVKGFTDKTMSEDEAAMYAEAIWDTDVDFHKVDEAE